MMLSSRLLSLSIHEALTFEGTEIALHPSLFNEADLSSGGSRSSKRHHVSISPSRSYPSLTQHHNRVPSVETIDFAPEEDFLPAAGKSAVTPRRLTVGSMIEIKVWDPLPEQEKRAKQSIRSSAPTGPLQAPSSRSTESNNSALSISEQTVTRNTVATKRQSPARSLQYSLDSSRQHKSSAIRNDGERSNEQRDADSSTISTLENSSKGPLSDAGELPNSSPHEQTLGSRTAVESQRLSLNKPPLIQRARVGAVRPSEDARRSILKTFNLAQQGHTRNISDMTMDTTLNGHNVAPEELSGQANETESAGGDGVLSSIAASHSLRLSFVMLIKEQTLSSLKGTARTQISILRQGM